MRRLIVPVLFVCTTLMLYPQVAAGPPTRTPPDRRIATHSRSDRPLADRPGFFVSSAVDTHTLADFDFGTNDVDPQGWVTIDRTLQDGTFFHVDDFAGLGGGASGGLRPVSGQKSLWCGTAITPRHPQCSTGCYPGYGNGWDQRFESVAFPSNGDVALSFQIRYDSEPGYDFITVEYKNPSQVWTTLLTFDGTGELLVTKIIPEASLPGYAQIRFRFVSDGVWSDEDCLWPTDGAAIVDNVSIMDSIGVLDFQDFESEFVGALSTADGDWSASFIAPYGDFAALYPGVSVLQEDLCAFNPLFLWGFFDDPANTAYYCHVPDPKPEQGALPRGSVEGQYLSNEIWSPLIDWGFDMGGQPIPPAASSAFLEFDVYRDMPLDNLQFYVWHVRAVDGGCPGLWRDYNFVYYGGQKDWLRYRVDIATLIASDTEQIQVAVGAWDMCAVWCNIFGSSYCHSHAPLFDNVRVIRVDHLGPLWNVSDLDLFQDNFPTDGTTTGTVRADIADDLLPGNAPGFRPGDSTCVTVSDPNDGLDYHMPSTPSSGPAVYCHVKDIDASKSGAALSDDPSRWPVVGSAVGWTVLRFDTAFSAAGSPVDNRFCVDLNDDLFTPPDTISFYFSARDAAGNTTYWSRLGGATSDEGAVRASPMEMTCLPANALNGGTDILLVDASDQTSDKLLFQSAFELLGLTPDRYDLRAPSSFANNGLASRVADATLQIHSYYKTIIWNSGHLSVGAIGDGPGGNGRKPDDFGLLLEFLDSHTNNPGVYFMGDDLASEWQWYAAGAAINLKNTYLSFYLIQDNHIKTGQPVSPIVVAQAGSLFDGTGGIDSLIAYGGCPSIRSFDVLGASNTATVAAAFSDNNGHAAVVSQETTNSTGATARAVVSGFSFDSIRDDKPQFPPDRVEHLRDVLVWFDNTIGLPTGTDPPRRPENHLAQNYPNPFNPTTRIQYRIKETSHVSLRIYNVAGSLVRILVDETQAPRTDGYTVVWDGTNNRGEEIASGVYFCRLRANNYSKTRKMVNIR